LRVKDAIRYIIDSIGDIYDLRESESIAFVVLDFIGFPRKNVLLNPEILLSNKNEVFINKVVKELKNSRPVQYVLGETEFFGIKLKVDENVLIPRQETEELVNIIIKENKISDPYILDLGTGSGCIAVSLAMSILKAKVFATDISPAAIEIAVHNAELNGIVINTFVDTMLNTNLDKNLKFNVIVSNPPYVTDSEKHLMHSNVINFEPGNALFVSDEEPLEYYKAIAGIATERLFTGGLVYAEINEKFGLEVAELFKSNGLTNIQIIHDINETDRFIRGEKL